MTPNPSFTQEANDLAARFEARLKPPAPQMPATDLVLYYLEMYERRVIDSVLNPIKIKGKKDEMSIDSAITLLDKLTDAFGGKHAEFLKNLYSGISLNKSGGFDYEHKEKSDIVTKLLDKLRLISNDLYNEMCQDEDSVLWQFLIKAGFFKKDGKVKSVPGTDEAKEVAEMEIFPFTANSLPIQNNAKALSWELLDSLNETLRKFGQWDKELFVQQVKDDTSPLVKFLGLFGMKYDLSDTKDPFSNDYLCWIEVEKMVSERPKDKKLPQIAIWRNTSEKGTS